MTTKTEAPLEPNHDADATPTDGGDSRLEVIKVDSYKPVAVLTKQQARDRIKAAGRGEDPDKVAPLTPPKAVHAAEPEKPEAPKPKKPKAEKPVQKSEPPAAPEPPAKKAEAKKPSAPPPPPAAKSEPPAPKAPQPKEKAELAKKARAVDRDAKRVEARVQQLQQAEQQINELFRKLDPSDPDAFMENLDAHLRASGKDMTAAVRAWAQKKMGRAAAPQTPGQPPPSAVAAPQAPQPGALTNEERQRLERLEQEALTRRAREAKQHWQGVYRQELTTTPPDPVAHPTLAQLDEEYLSEVMVMTASAVAKQHGIKLDTLQLYDMIEQAEAEELAAHQKKLKRKAATTASDPDHEPAGTQTQTHEPSKANRPIDVSSRARAGSAVQKPKGKIDRDKLRAVHRGQA